MSPGILQDTSLLELHPDTVLRARWDNREVDHKAVGGHLPLNKRNSTPVGTSMASPTSVHHAQLLHAQAKAASSPLTPMEAPNLHRRLDRSHSEPVVKAGGGGSGGGEGRQANSSRYKTELCRPFEENGYCKYGDKCQFAHGQAELRTLTRHPKYKTELCRTFHTSGFCPYGPRCHFIHNAEERRLSSSSGSSVGTHPPLSPKKMMMGNNSLVLGGSTSESLSPPASLHGSPTSSAGSFFDDTFPHFSGSYGLAGAKGLLDNLAVGVGSGGLGGGPRSPNGSSSSSSGQGLGELDKVREETLLVLAGLDTPPVSPVESLAGDLDSLSLSSSSHSSSPTPATSALDLVRPPRLPIFAQLTEQEVVGLGPQGIVEVVGLGAQNMVV